MEPPAELKEFMLVALQEAQQAFDAGEVPIGAVAVDEAGRIVAQARNRVEEIKSVTGHAEIELLKKIEAITGDWRMSDYTFYVTKEPCAMCSGAMINARVKRIVFGAGDTASGACGGAVDLPAVPGMLWHPEVVGGVLEEQCVKLLRDFFRARRDNRICKKQY